MSVFVFRHATTHELRRVDAAAYNGAKNQLADPEVWRRWECWDGDTCHWHIDELGNMHGGQRERRSSPDPHAYLVALLGAIEDAALAARGVARELARDRMLDRRAEESLREIGRQAATIHHDIAKARCAAAKRENTP